MLVWGGGDLSGVVTNTGALYDPATNVWTSTGFFTAPPARQNHVAVWTGTRMLVWGGFDGSIGLREGGIYDPATTLWTLMPIVNAPTRRSAKSLASTDATHGHSGVWGGTEMIIFGGFDSSQVLNTGGVFNPSTNTWRAIAASPSARVGHTAVWTGSNMIIWGGEDGAFITQAGQVFTP